MRRNQPRDPPRGGLYCVPGALAGGVEQVQSYCSNWETPLVQEMPAAAELRPSTFCLPAQGFLVIGYTVELKESREKATAFESFRRNLQNPEIITFDELLERARYIVGEGGP